jgi:hypothetical protein
MSPVSSQHKSPLKSQKPGGTQFINDHGTHLDRVNEYDVVS